MMLLAVKPHNRNAYPLGGLLLRGNRPANWLPTLQRLGIALHTTSVYVLPGPPDAASGEAAWGCLVVLPAGLPDQQTVGDVGAGEWLQVVDGVLFLPENTTLYPALADGEPADLLSRVPHLLHPSLGLVALTDVVDWAAYLAPPAANSLPIRRPLPGVSVPGRVHSFQVVPVGVQESIDGLTRAGNEAAGKPVHPPLSWQEKIRLSLLKLLFRPTPAAGQPPASGGPTAVQPTGLSGWLNRLLTPGNKWLDTLQQDFEKLAERNQEQLAQLLKLLRENPEMGLKYALPLDQDGSGRGGEQGGSLFNWAVRWLSLSLFDNRGQSDGPGGATLHQDHFAQLREQYNQTATELARQGKHQQAAFVYLKLLKEPYRAAQVLEEGKLFQEAAAVYLDRLNNREKAAECYEKGQLTDPAIALYKDLNRHEKVGDLYCATARPRQAQPHYQRVVDEYVGHRQFVKAALLSSRKMGEPGVAQHLLLEGWREQSDGINCLHLYLANIPDETARQQALETIYATEVSEPRREPFLQVLQHAFGQTDEHQPRLRDMAYEIIAAEAPRRPSLLTQLKAFNPADELVGKDVVRYRSRK